MKKSHALKPHAKPKPKIAWPSFQGTPTFVGASPSGRVSVYYDATLGAPGLQNASDLIANADSLVAQNDQNFGTTGGPVNVIIFALGGATDGTGGADHDACDYVDGANIEVCASFGHSPRVYGLFIAELSECSMNNNVCGESTGEALSRWCAMVESNNALSDFASAPVWTQDGMPNFVDTVDQTDTNYDSIGCGMGFLSWVQSLGYKLPKIAQSMVTLGDSGTLAQLYLKLTGDIDTNAWPKFQAAIAALPNGVTNDDPFGALAPNPQPAPAPSPNPAPTPTPQPGSGTSPDQLALLVIEAAVNDAMAGETEAQMKADIQSILDAN